MSVKNITTVFTTSKNQTISSGYEASLFETKEQMYEDFANDVNLQFETYEGLIETFTVIIRNDEDTAETRTYIEGAGKGINPFEIMEFVKKYLGIDA